MRTTPFVISVLLGFVSAETAQMWMSPEQKAKEERIRVNVENIADHIHEGVDKASPLVENYAKYVQKTAHDVHEKVVQVAEEAESLERLAKKAL